MDTIIAIAIITSLNAAPDVQYYPVDATLEECRAELEDDFIAPGVKVYCIKIDNERGCRVGPCRPNFALPVTKNSVE